MSGWELRNIGSSQVGEVAYVGVEITSDTHSLEEVVSLIEGAPDLLEAAKRVLPYFMHDSVFGGYLRDAIAKAEPTP